MKSADEIVGLWSELRKAGSDGQERMRQIARIVDGDVVIDVGGLSGSELPAVANQTEIGLGQMSQRLASLLPVQRFRPLRASKAQREAALSRTRVASSWWDEARMKMVTRQRARFLFGYGQTPVRIGMDFVGSRPTWFAANPLATFAPGAPSNIDLVPPFVVSVSDMSKATILEKWGAGDAGAALLLLLKDSKRDELHHVLDFSDDMEMSIVVAGPSTSRPDRPMPGLSSAGAGVKVVEVENRIGRCPWVRPGLFTLNKPKGAFDGVAPMYLASAFLTGLELHGAARSIYPESYLVPTGNGSITPQIVQPADPMSGVVGIIDNGTLETIRPDSTWQIQSTIDRLEGAARQQGGIPSDFSGQASTNVRTGARASQLISAQTDFQLDEGHDVLAASNVEEFLLAVEVDKAYLNKAKTVFVSWQGKDTEETYKPSDLWVEGAKPTVKYPVSGSDLGSLTIMTSQMMGAGQMSVEMAMDINPMVDDPAGELARIRVEKVEAALFSQIQSQAADPAAPFTPDDLAGLIRSIDTDGLSIADAVSKMNKEVQERQRAELESQQQPGLPDAGVLPGLGGEPPPGIAGPSQDQQNLASLMGNLRRPQMAVPTVTGGRA